MMPFHLARSIRFVLGALLLSLGLGTLGCGGGAPEVASNEPEPHQPADPEAASPAPETLPAPPEDPSGLPSELLESAGAPVEPITPPSPPADVTLEDIDAFLNEPGEDKTPAAKEQPTAPAAASETAQRFGDLMADEGDSRYGASPAPPVEDPPAFDPEPAPSLSPEPDPGPPLDATPEPAPPTPAITGEPDPAPPIPLPVVPPSIPTQPAAEPPLPPLPGLPAPMEAAEEPSDEEKVEEPVAEGPVIEPAEEGVVEEELPIPSWAPTRPVEEPATPEPPAAEVPPPAIAEPPAPAIVAPPAKLPKPAPVNPSNTRRLAWLLGARLSLAVVPESGVNAKQTDAIAELLGVPKLKVDTTGGASATMARLFKQSQALGAQLNSKLGREHAALFELSLKTNAIAILYEKHPGLAGPVADAIGRAAAKTDLGEKSFEPLTKLLAAKPTPAEVRNMVMVVQSAVDGELAKQK